MIRRTPLRRGASLQATSALSRTSRLKPRSEKRVKRNEENDAVVRAVVFARDGGRCQLLGPLHDRCFGPLTVHHLKKASHGGKYEADNLITLCAMANDWIEDHPRLAWENGMVQRTGDTPEEVTERRMRYLRGSSER